MRYIKTLFFLFILIFSFVAPYKAYVNDIPSFQQKTIDVYPGESINSVIDKFSSHNLINKIFIRIFFICKILLVKIVTMIPKQDD